MIARNDLEAKQHLADLHAYAAIYFGLEPGESGANNPKIHEMLDMIGVFLHSSSKDARSKIEKLSEILRRSTQPRTRLQPKCESHLIGRDFIKIGKEYDIWRYGVTYGWVADRFREPILGLPMDLPRHARVGLGVHAGSAAVEEESLLGDMYFLHVLTTRADARMWAIRHRIADPTSIAATHAAHQSLTRLNSNVGTHARSTVLTAAAFVESFVNSVGVNVAAERPTLASSIKEQLNGTRKGRYLPLEFKLERYPALIRTDGQSPLRVIDEVQRTAPFLRFLAETKAVRDASMHYAPSKIPIICTPQEWLARAGNAVADAMAVARIFWSACYPTSELPEYLYKFKEVKLRERAQERVAASEESID